MAATRSAHAVWSGDLLTGSGVVTATTSKAFNDLSVSWNARTTEEHGGSTSPEELVAAAHASCFSMAFSAGLGRGGTPPTKLEVDATVTFEQVDGGWKVVSSALKVVGTVPGLDTAGFQSAAEAAKDGCPISKMMTGNVTLSVEATLA
jgi:osmotically inducible protein OsmC